MKKSIDHISHARLLEELRIKSSAIDSAVNGIAFGDLEGRVTYGNAAAIDLTGYTLEEVLGSSSSQRWRKPSLSGDFGDEVAGVK